MGKQSREKREKRAEAITEKGGKLELLSSAEKCYLFIIRWGTYLVLFAPLVISLRFFFPFVAPKTIFFRIIIEIIAVAYIFLVITNRRWRPRINTLTIALTVFLGVFILASFTGVNLSRSFWSTYERMTGILTMVHLYAFFLILSNVFKRRGDWEKILGVSILVGVFLSLYILMGNEASSRGGGTIGNTSFMAAYLLFDIFFAVILLFVKRGGWQIYAGISLLLMLPVLFTSTARGAIIAFWGGLFLLLIGFFLFSQRKLLKRIAWAVILLIVVLAMFSAVFQPIFIKDKAESTLTEMKSRFVVWEAGLKGFQEKPILGWGPENFNNVFLRYFNPCMPLAECGTETWFDRVHNIVFDTLVATGLVGLLSYLAVFAAAFYGLLKTIPKIVERRNIFIPLGLIVVLITYFFQNLLVFDMINTYLVFFLTLAFIGFLTQKQTEGEENRIRKVNPILGSAIIIAMIFVVWTTNIKPLIANYHIINMVKSQDVTEASMFFEKSQDSWMEKYEAREHFSQKMSKVKDEQVPEESKPLFLQAFNLIEIEMEKSIEQNYLDFRHYLFLGELYNSDYRLSGNPEKIKRAEEVLEKAIQLSPTNQQGYWNLAEVKVSQGRAQDAIVLLQQAINLNTEVKYAHWYLAMGYRIIGEYELALDSIFEAEKVGYNLFGMQEEIYEIYQALVQTNPEIVLEYDKKLIDLYLKQLLRPNTPVEHAYFLFRLAISYANSYQYEKAREIATELIEFDSSYQQKIEELIKTFPVQ